MAEVMAAVTKVAKPAAVLAKVPSVADRAALAPRSDRVIGGDNAPFLIMLI